MLQGSPRLFLLTKSNFVLADQKTGQVKASVPLPDLASVSVSTQSDGFFALKLKEVMEGESSTLMHLHMDIIQLSKTQWLKLVEINLLCLLHKSTGCKFQPV